MCSGSDAPGSSTVPRGKRGRVSATPTTLRSLGAVRRTANGPPGSAGRGRRAPRRGRGGSPPRQVGRRDRVAERGAAQGAQLGDCELVRPQREGDVRVGELGPEPVKAG